MSDQVGNEKPRKILGSNGDSNTNLSVIASPAEITRGQYYLQPVEGFLEHMERLRLTSNMMAQQEMHAVWPYGATTFLSNILPTHNMGLPYALAGAMPYTAVPFFAGGQQQCTMSPVSSLTSASSSVGNFQNTMQQQQQQQQAIRSNMPTMSIGGNGGGASGGNNSSSNQNDSNKINIQIGVQCVSQNTPGNYNAVNESLPKVNLLNFSTPPVAPVADKEIKDTNLLSSPPLAASLDAAAGGDAGNVLANEASGNTVSLSQTKFNDMIRLALRGSETAEQLAFTHRNRPCFKKIDSLCARLKQDLIRPDGVLANINSQGFAWAVKDLIFVFTRIMNAWIIIKGYVYNNHEGLSKVKSALSPDFAPSFSAWQDTTMVFIENLIKSFVNLDMLVQSQKNVYQRSDGMTANGNQNGASVKVTSPTNPLLDDAEYDFLNSTFEKTQQTNNVNKNYLYTMVKDSEGSQRQATVNGTYFQTGTYNPIKKDSLLTEHTPTTNNSCNVGDVGAMTASSLNAAFPQLLSTNNTPSLQEYGGETLPELWPTGSDIDPDTAAAITAVAASSELLKLKEKVQSNWLDYNFNILNANLAELTPAMVEIEAEFRKSTNKTNLNIIISRLMSMENAEMFFMRHFTKNYFPDFVDKHQDDFLDVRSILIEHEMGHYQHIYEVVHDVKRIIYVGKEFLKVRKILYISD